MVDLSMKVAGIDTAKAQLHLCILPEEMKHVFANDAGGIAALVATCQEAQVVRAGIEATSIYHRPAMAALRAAGIAVAELQPRQVKAFAVAVLNWAKSDPADARVIARLAQIVDKVRPGVPQNLEALAETLTFIEQLEERITWLKTSLERFSQKTYVRAITADIKRLEKQRRTGLAKLEAKMRKDGQLASRLDLLLSIPGLGQRTAIGFLIRMPELGSMAREEAASLAGLAPHLHESGGFKGQCHIHGGRARLRTTAFRAAFTSAMHWNEDLKTFYARLRQNGKAHTAAVTACARKLIILANAILARGTPWIDKRVMP